MSVALGRASLAEARREAQSDPARGAVHRLPCRVHRTGPARVAAFFSPAVRTGDGGELATSFRGRELKGRAVPLPPGYSGVVVREESAGTSLRHEVTTTATATATTATTTTATTTTTAAATTTTTPPCVWGIPRLCLEEDPHGLAQPVPCGVVAAVHSDRRATALRAFSAFSAISHWNLETAPSGDDALPMALAWPALADAIHGSEDEDD